MTGHHEAALGELARAPEPGLLNGPNVTTLLSERFLRASLLDRLDRSEEALAVYGSLIFGNPNSIVLAIPAALQRARLLARLNRLVEARRDYQTVIDGWRHADAILQPVVDSARAELSRLHR